MIRIKYGDIMAKKIIRIHEGELNIMELLWSNGSLPAKDIAKIIKEFIGWEKNTTYTVINRLIKKEAIKREDPGFICTPLISKKRVQDIETEVLLKTLFEGSFSRLVYEYAKNNGLSKAERMEMLRIANDKMFTK